MLIIYAHPNKLGHSGEYLKQIEKVLKSRKIEYDVMDFYEMNYDPVLCLEEHYTSGRRQVSEENKKIQIRIKKENKFIFIYPVWWNNIPAILKGFFDRVFVSGFAFRYVNHRSRGLLSGQAVVFSSSGSPRIWERLIAKDRALKVVTKDILRFCGLKSKAYSVGWSNELNERQKRKIFKLVKKGLKYLI